MQRRVGSRLCLAILLSLMLAGGLAAATTVGADLGSASEEPTVAETTDDPLVSGSASQTIAPSDVTAPAGSGTASTAEAGALSTDAASASQYDETIVERVEYDRLPDEPGRVEARIVYEIPDNVGSLRFRIVQGQYEVVGTDGFAHEDGEFVWDETGDGGTVTIRHDAAESFRQEGADEQFVGGTEDWAIVTRPQTSTSWSYRWDNPGLEYQLAAATEGYAGKRFAFLGPYQAHSETVDGETITLVVPDAADVASEPGEILDSLTYASDRLRFGNRNDEVVTIAAPTGEVDWGPPGLAVGSDARVVADARVDDRVNVWVHEYVHTRQYRDAEVAEGDAVADDAHWVIEGSADYYAALLSLEQGRIDFQTFRSVLERGADAEYDDVVLADRSTWASNDAEYEKGALLVGAIDRQIREASDGSTTFQAVMQDWNDAETFTADDLEASAAEHGDEGVREFVETHTRSTATPSAWDRDVHEANFGGDLARFDYRVVSEPTLSVEGPYRSGALREPLVVGEHVSTTVRVENVGDVAGSYRATLVVGEDDRAVEMGSLDPGESTTVDLSQRLTRTGDLRIVTGDVSRTVSVREPATPAVSRLQVEPRSPVAGDEVRITLSVANPTNRPADGNLTVRADGEPLGAERVQLAPRANDTVELTPSFEEPGEYNVTAGELTVGVSVQDAGVLDRLPTVAVVALAAVAVLALAGGGALFYRRDR